MCAITAWWFISAHKWFKGPKVNVEHMMAGHLELQGIAVDEPQAQSSSDEADSLGSTRKGAAEKGREVDGRGKAHFA